MYAGNNGPQKFCIDSVGQETCMIIINKKCCIVIAEYNCFSKLIL